MKTEIDQKKPDELTDHEYDGIQEFDNPTPGWWIALFLASCLFSICYYIFFQMGQQGWTIHDSYESDVVANLKLQFAEVGELESDAGTLFRLLKDPKLLTIGKATYKGNCVSCHGADASGLIGPNLTDDYWKNVDQIEEIAEVVNEGAANGAMPGWKTRLHPNEVVLVSAYVASLRGQNKKGPRGQEGEIIPSWDANPSTLEP